MWTLILRNPLRQRWRALLTVAGIATGVALLVWSNAFTAAWMDAMVRGATAVETGQVQVHAPRWVERESLYASMDAASLDLAAIARTAGVTGVAPRVRAHGLVGNETRSTVVRLVGIDPVAEPRVTSLQDALSEGVWLPATPPDVGARPALIGVHLARQLGVGLGDELVVFAQAADGSLGNDLVTVVGLLRAEQGTIDRGSVYLHLDDLRFLVALEGRLHELAIATSRLDDAEPVAARLQAQLGDPATDAGVPVVRPWRTLQPEIATMIDTSGASSLVLYFFVYLIVALGIVNTQRMAAMERRREFGILHGLGLRPARVGTIVLAETVLLVAVGGVVGLVLGYAAVLWFHVRGLSLTGVDGGEGFTMMGIAFADRLYFPLEAASATGPMIALLLVGVLCGVRPAWWAMRLDAVRAISGRPD